MRLTKNAFFFLFQNKSGEKDGNYKQSRNILMVFPNGINAEICFQRAFMVN